ncbi:hypothetical protein MMC25_001392 [Agyrium rufum]|nr:hypothetical protein [Agyrium rufum]
MPARYKDGDVIVAFSAKWISWTHTIVAYAAFLGALITGLWLHYHKIVQNEHYGYPQEWFPSVSSTIGDRYPERSVFQVFIAITSGPRFILVLLWYFLTARSDSVLPKFILGVGVFRTLTCGGWTYVTSTDDHNWHDIFMISYLVATLPWTLGCLALSPANAKAVKYRKILGGCFFGTLVPLIYFFIQHKVHKVAGAYTVYAFFEWALVLFDVSFDAVTAIDFDGLELVVRDVKGLSRGEKEGLHPVEREKAASIRKTFDEPSFLAEIIDAVADTYNAFIFWSQLTSLGLLVWYFPLWHMGISGFEAFIMSTVSPALLAIKPFRSFAMRNLRFIHLLSLSGLLSYLITSQTLRLSVLGFGVSMSCLGWSTMWFADTARPGKLEKRALTFGLGLIASSIAKFTHFTNNPVWPVVHSANGGNNKLGIALAVIAILRSVKPVVPGSVSSSGYSGPKGSPFFASIGFAGLMFGLHSLLSDSSTIVLWVWSGFPIKGPIAAHGVLVLMAMGGGLYLDVLRPGAIPPLTRCLMLGVGSVLVTALSNWIGFLGGLLCAFSLMSLTPTIIMSGARSSPALTFGLGFLLYNILVLAHVWVIAYAFVPGGPLMREHTDWVMTAMVIAVSIGVLNSPQPLKVNGKGIKAKKGFLTSQQLKSHGFLTLLGLEILAFATSYIRFPTNDYSPYHKDDKMITAGIWCIHFYLDNDMWSSEYRMRDVIKELELDVVGLLETDTQHIIGGNRDMSQFLAEDLGMYVDFGPGPDKHTWGCVLLSKFPILNSTHHLLPSPVGELAPAIHATLDAYGEMVDVVVFHSGQEEDAEDRRLQSEYLAKLMHDSPRPTILLSYLTTPPYKDNYLNYVGEKSGMSDIDPSDWDRWCEYILYKGIKRTGYARVSRSTITDTEIQVGKFAVGKPQGGNDRISEQDVPEGFRFPAMFRGEGVRGHRYHVFDEPRYFA